MPPRSLAVQVAVSNYRNPVVLPTPSPTTAPPTTAPPTTAPPTPVPSPTSTIGGPTIGPSPAPTVGPLASYRLAGCYGDSSRDRVLSGNSLNAGSTMTAEVNISGTSWYWILVVQSRGRHMANRRCVFELSSLDICAVRLRSCLPCPVWTLGYFVTGVGM